MSQTPQTTDGSKILGAFAGTLTIFSIALYFSGWIYRWAYFGFFRIQLTTLDLPAQSFFFVPIQVFLGSPQSLIKALLLFAGAVLATVLILIFLKRTAKKLEATSGSNQIALVKFMQKWSVQSLYSDLVKDLVIVASILIALYWIARWQGEADAWQAAVNNTSPLPVISLVQSEKGLGLGYNPKDATYSSLDKARVIGDVGLFHQIRGQEVKIPGTSNQVGDWRLLISSKGWLYLFQALPPKTDRTKRPIVLAVREGGEQLMILSPSASDETVP